MWQDQLQQEVCTYRQAAFAPSTTRSYNVHRQTYLRFCNQMGYSPVPASSETICQFAAFLARSKSFSSVKQYLNIIRMLHLEWGLPNPIQSDYDLTLVLKGIKRTKGNVKNQKLPVTPDILLSMLNRLNMSKVLHANVWAAALVMFYTLLRRANVLPPSIGCFNPLQHLTRGDVKFFHWGVQISVRWTKTVQFRERVLSFPLPRLPNHPLCPVQAIVHAFSFHSHVPNNQPAWALSPTGHNFLTVSGFISVFKRVITQMGLNPDKYAGHSFRRGGATWAYQCGLSADTIEILGDWKSDAYKQYLKPDMASLLVSVKHMQSKLPKKCS